MAIERKKRPSAETRWEIDADDVADIALGSTLLGAGGGGDPYLNLQAMKNLIEQGAQVVVTPLNDIDDESNVLCIAGIGAPTVEAERMQSLDTITRCIDAYESHFGVPIHVLVAAEMGGGNALTPLLASAENQLPVIDGDGMGRAFPEMQMTSFYLNGIPTAPFVIADDHGNVVACEVANSSDPKSAESFARSATIEMGMMANIACYRMTGKEAKKAVLPGTLTLSRDIGRQIVAARGLDEPVRYLVSSMNEVLSDQPVVHLFDGKIVDLWRTTEKGFATGWCELVDLGGNGDLGKVEFQNEFLRFQVNGSTRAIAPDLVCMVDSETLTPIPTPDARYGQRVSVIGIACHQQFTTDDALKVVGPAAFGYDDQYERLTL